MNENEKLKEIIRLGAELNTVQDIDILLERILFEARKCVSADAGTIYIREGDVLVFSHAQNDTQQKKLSPGKKLIYSSFKVPINEKSIAGYVASTGENLNIPDVYSLEENLPVKFDPAYDRLSGYKTQSMLTLPLKTSNGAIVGILQMINSLDARGAIKVFDETDELFVSHFASSASIVLQRARMTRTLLLRMIAMAEQRDPKETGAHVNRVASYAVEIYERWARAKGVANAEIERTRDILRMAAMLHDAGKVAISDLILKKPGKFTDDEYDVIKTHTWLGAQLFKDQQSEFDAVASEVALTHHENWDGTGYPGWVDVENGKPLKADAAGRAVPRKGGEIPILGRIVAIADVYDALSCRRVYKDPWDEKSVLDELKKLSGSKFDPDVVDAFFESLDSIRSIAGKYPDKE